MNCDHLAGSDGVHLGGGDGDHLGGGGDDHLGGGGGVCPKKIGRRAPVSGRESVEAYTPDCKQREEGELQRHRPTKELKVEAHTPHNTEEEPHKLEIKVKEETHTVQQ